jgi:hypothetical protein
MNGFTFYRGPSMLDGSQIRLVGTCLATASQNQKTGDCSQFFILPDLVSPAKGKDRAGVCGDCPIINACYLRWGWIARQVWETDYPDYKPADTKSTATEQRETPQESPRGSGPEYESTLSGVG